MGRGSSQWPYGISRKSEIFSVPCSGTCQVSGQQHVCSLAFSELSIVLLASSHTLHAAILTLGGFSEGHIHETAVSQSSRRTTDSALKHYCYQAMVIQTHVCFYRVLPALQLSPTQWSTNLPCSNLHLQGISIIIPPRFQSTEERKVGYRTTVSTESCF